MAQSSSFSRVICALGVASIPAAAYADSRSSVNVNGKTVTASGGSRHSLNADDAGVLAVLDDHIVRVMERSVSVDGSKTKLPRYDVIDIVLGPDGIRVLVDGETLITPPKP